MADPDEGGGYREGLLLPGGPLRVLKMPFALQNAPAMLQRALDLLMLGITREVLVYLDNLIIFASIFKMFLEWLENVFQLLVDANL